MSDLLMPKLSDTMEEGTVLKWLVADGAPVTRGQDIVEIETDKADMTVQATADGALAIIAQEGAVLPVGAPIARIGGAAAAGDGTPPDTAAAAPPTDDLVTTNIPVGDDGTAGEIAAPVTQAPAADATGTAPPSGVRSDGTRIIASPLARQVAHDAGLDLATVHGTGPGGRIVRADVDAALGAGPAASAPSPAAPAPPAPAAPSAPSRPAEPGQRIPATRLQRTIARRMRESVDAAPHFALQRDVEATELIALRRQLAATRADLPTPTVTDLIVRALALACAERPDALARWDGDGFLIPDGVHVGLAVAVDHGLVVPVLRDANRKSVFDIAVEARDLVTRCRDATITASELEGSTITVSNLGMFGVDRFTAVINPPEAAILAVGAARPQPVVRDGQIVVRDMMTFTLSADHRTLYGAEAATFLGRIAELVEMPYSLVAGA